jgi:nucleoside-diphosphate-sugar epimerase
MTKGTVCIVGGTGFVGHAIAAQLCEAGYEVTIISRHRERHRDLLVLPTVRVINGDVFDYAFLVHEFEGKDVVINLVGILNEGGEWRQKFHVAHIQLTEFVAEACRVAGVRRLLHMSALHATERAPSKYMRTKARAENIAHAAAGNKLKVTSFRPSTIFGKHDSFLNRFSRLLNLVPYFFPLASGHSRMQPVYVQDVARCFVQSIGDYRTYGQRYDLCGPKVYTLKQIVEYVAFLRRRRVRVVALGQFLSWMQARILQMAPGKPFSVDNYLSLKVDSVCHQGFPNVFGIKPTEMEEIAPTYIGPDLHNVWDDYRSDIHD